MEKRKQERSGFDVWVTGLPDEQGLKGVLQVKLMRRSRARNADTLVKSVPAVIEVLNVAPRRHQGATESTRRELEVEVVFAEKVPRGQMNQFDDGRGLEAFAADTHCTLVYWPSDRMARVSRHSEVLK